MSEKIDSSVDVGSDSYYCICNSNMERHFVRHLMQGATTSIENRNSFPTVPLTPVLNNVTVSGTVRFEVKILHFLVWGQKLRLDVHV